jgi:hypothetical protein
MAFLDRGPQPEITVNENGVRYIDPNPTNEIVNHEDLVMYVKLVARTKGRSIITSDGVTTEIEAELKNVNKDGETNFTYSTGEQYMDTKWTNIGGGSTVLGEDLGAFGITNINIEFKSSFMPQITIDFVDVRGATLFEQGPCSPYSLFFHLPYPVFELTVKGYYGKPVTYTLALTKFNTKFNDKTGNFESKAEFVGYTYAFLADIPIGYVMASTYMKDEPYNADDILVEKWEKLRSLHPELTNGKNALPEEPLTMFDLVRQSKKLETSVSKLKNTVEVVDVAKISNGRSALNALKGTILEYQREVLTAIGGQKSKSGIRVTNDRKNTLYVLIPEGDDTSEELEAFKKVNETYLGTGDDFTVSEIGLAIATAKSELDSAGLGSELGEISFDKIKGDMSNFYGTSNVENSDFTDYTDWFIDIYPNLLKVVETAITSVDKRYKEKREEVQEKLNQEVKNILGFWPSIRNVFAIILTNVEVFLQLLVSVSVDAEKYHAEENFDTSVNGTENGLLELLNQAAGAQLSNEQQDAQQKNKVYPWPTYWRKEVRGDGDETDPGEKEEYPGENENFVAWPEVRFVESFVDALTKLREDLEDIEASTVDNEPGFDDYVPTTAFETHVFGDGKAPSRWYRIENGIPDCDNLEQSITCLLGENAFLFGDYSCINSLSLWKSQIGFTNGWGFETITNGNGTTNGYTNVTDKLSIGPQRIAENPIVTSNISGTNQLGRYGGNGFNLTDTKMSKRHNWSRHISPVTKTKMKAWGKIDALNFLSVCSSTGNAKAIRWMSALVKTDNLDKKELKKLVLEALEQKYGGNFKKESFNDWKVSATSEIGGTSALIDKQNKIWDGHYKYVKSNNVLTLKGPIELNYSEVTDFKISANPHNNSEYNGVRLIPKGDQIYTARSIEIDKERTTDKLVEQYKSIFGEKRDNGQEVKKQETDSDGNKTEEVNDEGTSGTNSIQKISLLGLPKFFAQGSVAYYESKDKPSISGFNVDPQLNMLNYCFEPQFTGIFFHNYKQHAAQSASDGSTIINDLGSSRRVYTKEFGGVNKYDWANFVGPGDSTENGLGAADSFVQTPLWTLNYPRFKNPYYGLFTYVSNGESILKSPDRIANKSESQNDNGPGGAGSKESNNGGKNYSRNYATWWGMNQYYTDESSIGDKKYLLPLAYLTVMSLGLDSPISNSRSGHFPPFDGTDFTQLSSFSNFTHTHVTATPTKSWLLLIGAILWRMKEGGMLRWKGEELVPEKSFLGWNGPVSNQSSVGIDDLSDPVWFFHNSLSAPIFAGGSVLADRRQGQEWGAQSPTINYAYQYIRNWIGRDKSGCDRWTDSVPLSDSTPGDTSNNVGYGSSQRNYGTSANRLKGGHFIGPYTDASNMDRAIGGGTIVGSTRTIQSKAVQAGWVKSHWVSGLLDSTFERTASADKIRKGCNISWGMFDQCRQDQIPFVMNLSIGSETIDQMAPKTLVITDLSNTRNRKYYDNGAVVNAPNRVENEYVTIKEQVKELMFLPKSLMISFINYFETWATSSSSAFNGFGEDFKDRGWLNTLDPLNWEPKFGLPGYKFNIKNYCGVAYNSGGDYARWTGLRGWLSNTAFGATGDWEVIVRKGYTSTSENKVARNGRDKYGYSEFSGDDKALNPWFRAYGLHYNGNVTGTRSSSSGSGTGTSGRYYPKPGEGGCFITGSKILLINGKYKNIEDITTNDIVKSYNLNTNQFEEGIVSSISMTFTDDIIKIYLNNGKTITSTAGHVYYVVGKGWSNYRVSKDYDGVAETDGIKSLDVGDEVYYYDGGKFEKMSINKILEISKGPTRVWNLQSVEANNNFIVNNVLAHNVSG